MVRHRKVDRVVMRNQRQEHRKSEMLSKFRTMYYFLNVKHYYFYISETVGANAEMLGHICGYSRLPSNAAIANIIFRDLDLFLEIIIILNFYILER